MSSTRLGDLANRVPTPLKLSRQLPAAQNRTALIRRSAAIRQHPAGQLGISDASPHPLAAVANTAGFHARSSRSKTARREPGL
jgi:hypothetical protein